jgi:hypothetical protein
MARPASAPPSPVGSAAEDASGRRAARSATYREQQGKRAALCRRFHVRERTCWPSVDINVGHNAYHPWQRSSVEDSPLIDPSAVILADAGDPHSGEEGWDRLLAQRCVEAID